MSKEWKTVFESETTKVKRKKGWDMDTNKPAIEYLYIDKKTGERTHEVYVATKDGWALVHKDVKGGGFLEADLVKLTSEQKRRNISFLEKF